MISILDVRERDMERFWRRSRMAQCVNACLASLTTWRHFSEPKQKGWAMWYSPVIPWSTWRCLRQIWSHQEARGPAMLLEDAQQTRETLSQKHGKWESNSKVCWPRYRHLSLQLLNYEMYLPGLHCRRRPSLWSRSIKQLFLTRNDSLSLRGYLAVTGDILDYHYWWIIYWHAADGGQGCHWTWF